MQQLGPKVEDSPWTHAPSKVLGSWQWHGTNCAHGGPCLLSAFAMGPSLYLLSVRSPESDQLNQKLISILIFKKNY